MTRESHRGERRLLLFMLVFLSAGASSGCLGSGGEAGAPAPASALRKRFPEQAARVLEPEAAFVATGKGFALDTPGAGGVSGALS